MPITKSAKKALKVSKRRQAENLLMKQEIKNRVKGLRLSVTAKSKDVTKELSLAYSSLDKAAKKHLIHKNKASRLKSRLTKAAKAAELKIDSKIKEKAAAKPVTKTAKPTKKVTKK
jgi:small subunit ribosomal protein S20